jgi:hypothetical protein
VLALAVLVRLLFLGSYPLADTTEARYAEVARLMLVSGDWITPQIEAGVPFWGKPPLSFWLTAGSFKLFGISEFAARPSSTPAIDRDRIATPGIYRRETKPKCRGRKRRRVSFYRIGIH